jgi:hypothetical protein
MDEDRESSSSSNVSASISGFVAIAAVVIGILGFFVPYLGLVAVILGIIGLMETRQRITIDHRLAMAGLILGIAGLLVSAAFIPSIFQPRISQNEASMIGGLKTIAAAEVDELNNSLPHSYWGDLSCLSHGYWEGIRFLDPALRQGLKSGYTFDLKGGAPINGPNGLQIWTWSATAWPVTYKFTGVRTGYIDETGVVRAENIGGGKGDIRMKTVEK